LAADPLLGATGQAVTDLRPSGRVRIGSNLVDVTTEGGFVARGTEVRVIRVQGDRVLVTAVETP
jgi:membrane-bound serine protease (ClpP class)